MNVRLVFAVLFLVAALCGCMFSFGCAAAGPDADAATLAARIADGQLPEVKLSYMDNRTPGFDVRMESVYGIPPDLISAGAVYYGTGASPEVIMVLQTKGVREAEEVSAHLETYIEKRIQVFDGYAPEAAAELAHRALARSGSWIGLFVCSDPQAAQRAFEVAFCGGEVFSADSVATAPPAKTEAPAAETASSAPSAGQISGRYDHDAVVAAYRGGDADALDPVSRSVYDTAARILAEATDAGMSDFEKELAVHDYITSHVSYDEAVLEDTILPTRDLVSADAYGALVQGTAVCYGYSDSFQLLMDMLGIECITVSGTANAEREPHAWNMVRLDDEWYCVDVTWDDPVGTFAFPNHRNFNVTTQQMRETGNRIPDGPVPDAKGGPWAGDLHF